MPRKNLWTEEEIAYLKENFGKIKRVDMVSVLGRSYSAIGDKILSLGLKNEERPWKQEETDFLLEHYETMSYKEIGDIIGRTKNAVQCRMRRLGLVKPDKYFYNVDFFENIDTEEKAYWLGFIWADGWVHRSSNNSELGIELKETDTSHLEKFNKSLGGNVEITHHINDQRDNDFMKIDFTYSCKIRLYRKKIVDDVCKYGIDENKTYNDIPIPPQIPDELVRHFIRGFFDGDGTVHYVKNIHTKQLKYIIYNASYVMLESMRQELYKHGIYSQIIEDTRDIKRKTVPCYRLVIGGLENTENFYHYLYDDMTIFLDRKFEYATENREEHNLEERAKRQHGKKTKRDCLSIQ